MCHPNGKIWLVFNGEIYNFKELRSELTLIGETFRSESDTEVVISAYARWGVAGLQRFRGMFAFALWDFETQTLLLARDRFGVKPLYYSLGSGGVTFASEIRGLMAGTIEQRTASADGLAEFLLPAVDALQRHKDYLRAHPAHRIERQVPLPP